MTGYFDFKSRHSEDQGQEQEPVGKEDSLSNAQQTVPVNRLVPPLLSPTADSVMTTGSNSTTTGRRSRASSISRPQVSESYAVGNNSNVKSHTGNLPSVERFRSNSITSQPRSPIISIQSADNDEEKSLNNNTIPVLHAVNLQRTPSSNILRSPSSSNGVLLSTGSNSTTSTSTITNNNNNTDALLHRLGGSAAISSQFNNFQLQPLTTLHSNNSNSHLQTQSLYNSSSASSSTKSSRRPSAINSNIAKFIANNHSSTQQQQHAHPHQLPPIKTSLSSGSGIPTLSSYNKDNKKTSSNNMGQNEKHISKTVMISPSMSTTHFQSTPNDLQPHNSSSTILQSTTPLDATGTNITSNTSMSTNSVPRSTNTGSNISLRSFKKQYILNEQLYLERMKNKVHDDEYYTRGIAASSSSIMDSEDDLDLDAEDHLESANIHNMRKINDRDNFGFNFFTTNMFPNRLTTSSSYDNLLGVTPNFLLRKLEWLKSSDPEKKQVIDELLQQIQYIEQENDKNNTLQATLQLETIFEKLFNDKNVLERLEWQTMLFNVLKGDIVRSEKTKIAKEGPRGFNNERNDDLWLELRSWMNGRSVEDQKKSIRALRDSVDTIIEEIMNFTVEEDTTADETEILISALLNKYYKVMNLWPTVKKMQADKPKTQTLEFNNKVNVMLSWVNIKQNLSILSKKLAIWIGVDDLDSHGDEDIKDIIREKRKQFAEQVMKEKDIESIFQKKIFYPLAPWMVKTKRFYVENMESIHDLNLPVSNKVLVTLLLFPLKLLKGIISVRIAYAKKLRNPTMMMIDQMIYDFSSYIRLSVQLKYTLMSYLNGFHLNVGSDDEFEKIIIEAIKYLFILLQLKILDGTTAIFRTSKEPELLLKYWDNLKNVGYYINGAGSVISLGFSKLTLRLLHRLHSYLTQQQNNPPRLTTSLEAEKWTTQIFETLGSTKRKLNRFTNVLTKAFQNSVNYQIENYETLLEGLKNSGHFLLYTGGDLEDNGIYLIGSQELLGSSDEEIMKILESTNIGCDLLPKLDINNSLTLYNGLDNPIDLDTAIVHNYNIEDIPYHGLQSDYKQRKRSNTRGLTDQDYDFNGNNHFNKNFYGNNVNNGIDANTEAEQELVDLEAKLQSLGYILILHPSKPIVWEGTMYNLSEDTVLEYSKFPIHNAVDTITLISQGSSYALEYQCDKFLQWVGSSVSFIEKKCLIDDVENTLHRMNKAYFGCTYSMLNDYNKIIKALKTASPSTEIMNGIFLFIRDFGRNFLKNNVANSEKKSIIIILMVKISVSWLTFLTDECDPTDQKTFRWCVTAMEFAMQMISGWNILALDEDQFKLLKQKISACMSLLISHFDVMGARATELDNSSQQQSLRTNAELIDDFDVDSMLYVNSQLRLQTIDKLEETFKVNPRQIGKVLDDRVGDNKYITSLASSMSNVSIRWQKRKFVGGGTFGSVYAAVNLDNGDILAVKEIKIQNSKAMQKIFPSIKEEMTVMEMLNHPNIIQYYGVEVHRDKVNIFMEYCEGGSLSNLLEHGRIEDEMVTQMYTLELLEGLAYLHESGIVHRDIKPENILLDFNGIIKYVDFGAARKIARNGTVIQCSKQIRGESADITINDTSTPTTVTTNTSMPSTGTKNTSANASNVQGMIGTPMYMAPESITGSKHKGSFGADDVWSLGCVVLEMITGRRPWANLDNEWAIMYQVAAGQIPQLPNDDEVSKAGRKFLKRSLVYNPNKRATAVELLMDPWIVEIRELAFGTTDDSAETTTPVVMEENES